MAFSTNALSLNPPSRANPASLACSLESICTVFSATGVRFLLVTRDEIPLSPFHATLFYRKLRLQSGEALDLHHGEDLVVSADVRRFSEAVDSGFLRVVVHTITHLTGR